MNSLYLPILVAHVIFAVFGAGLVVSVAVVAGSARRAGRIQAEALASVGALLRWSAIGLAAILATGILLGITGGSIHQAGWFRASALLLIPTGILHARSRQTLRRGLSAGDDGSLALRRLERNGWAMTAIIGVIVVLMEAKPF